MRKKIELTEEQKTDLGELTTSQLRDRYGWTLSQVKNFRNREGIKDYPLSRKQRQPVPLPSELEGKTLGEIQEKYNVSRSTAMQWFSTRGVSYTKYRRLGFKSEIKSLKKTIKFLRVAAVFPYLRDAEIARALKISRERIRQLRNEVGIAYIGDKLKIDFDDAIQHCREKSNDDDSECGREHEQLAD